MQTVEVHQIFNTGNILESCPKLLVANEYRHPEGCREGMAMKFYVFIVVFSSSFVMQSSQGGGHRTLLYGHAILLRHCHSDMVSRIMLCKDSWSY